MTTLACPFVCPFELRVHPDLDGLEADAMSWAARVGLGQHDQARFGWLGAACYPDGAVERVLLATNVLQWIFAFDDYIDEPTTPAPLWRLARQALLSVRVVEDPDHPVNTDGEPCLAALDDIGRRLRRIATAAQYQRFVAGLTEWVMGQVCGSMADGSVAAEDYGTVRRYNTNGLISFSLIEVTTRVALPDEVWRRPELTALTRVASDIMGYTNDIHSWPKEHAHDQPAANLPNVVAREHHIPLAEAVERATDRVKGLYRRFQDIAALLRRTALPALEVYLAGLEAWLAGQHHWYAHTDRYIGEPVTKPQDTLHLTDYQQGVAAYWNATADPVGDPQNVKLGEVDGLYHHHYGLGEVDNPVLGREHHETEENRDRRVIAELHRLETAQANFLLDQFEHLGVSHRLLDAGCGRGGTSFLAHQRFGSTVDGVTISDYQARFANTQAAERGCDTQVRFHLSDMLHTPFDTTSFHGVWTNETTMYVYLNDLYREFARVLAVDGRYVCITGCHNDGWGLRVSPAVARINERYQCSVHPRSSYFDALAGNGFVPIKVQDLTPLTLPYWRLRAQSSIATGVERDFLEAYEQGSFHYLLIVADRVSHI